MLGDSATLPGALLCLRLVRCAENKLVGCDVSSHLRTSMTRSESVVDVYVATSISDVLLL